MMDDKRAIRYICDLLFLPTMFQKKNITTKILTTILTQGYAPTSEYRAGSPWRVRKRLEELGLIETKVLTLEDGRRIRALVLRAKFKEELRDLVKWFDNVFKRRVVSEW